MTNKERKDLLRGVRNALENVEVCGRSNLNLLLAAIQQLDRLWNDMSEEEHHDD